MWHIVQADPTFFNDSHVYAVDCVQCAPFELQTPKQVDSFSISSIHAGKTAAAGIKMFIGNDERGVLYRITINFMNESIYLIIGYISTFRNGRVSADECASECISCSTDSQKYRFQLDLV